jgi:hypothetical protein
MKHNLKFFQILHIFHGGKIYYFENSFVPIEFEILVFHYNQQS